MVLGGWYPLCAPGPLDNPCLKCSVLGLWVSSKRELVFVEGPVCRRCVSLLEPGTRKQALLTLFVYEIKGPWKGYKKTQIQEVRLVTQKEQKTNPPACSCFPSHRMTSVRSSERQMARVPSLRHLLRFGLMHSIAKPVAFEGSCPSLLPGPLEIWEKGMRHFAKDRAKT